MGDNHPHTRRLKPATDDRPGQRPKAGPVSTFDPEQFAKAIQTLGLQFRWSRAIECPCSMEGPDSYKPDCDLCGADGWWYVNPNHKAERHLGRTYTQIPCTFGVQGMNLKWDQFQPFGGWDSGEAIMTIQHEAAVSFRDRFVGIEQRMGRTELLLRDANDLVRVGHGGRTATVAKASMRYEPLRINFVGVADGTRYYEGTDFRLREPTLTEPRRMEWLTGQGPAEGTKYSVHYDCHPVWIVTDASYGIQGLVGPEAGLKGQLAPRLLPTTFKVALDFLTQAVGS